MTRRGDWMQTFSGRQFWPCDPRADEVCIEDIAHALSMQCRFAGHVRKFYSVAEHCVRASWIVPDRFKLAALLHDAAEAYVVDLPRPIKRQPELRAYLHIEERVEARDLMGGQSAGKWRLRAEPLPEAIVPWNHEMAEWKFLERFREVAGR